MASIGELAVAAAVRKRNGDDRSIVRAREYEVSGLLHAKSGRAWAVFVYGSQASRHMLSPTRTKFDVPYSSPTRSFRVHGLDDVVVGHLGGDIRVRDSLQKAR